jgi:hypothetical protein
MEDPSGQAVVAFASVELDENASAVGLVIDIRQQAEDFSHALHLANHPAQR